MKKVAIIQARVGSSRLPGKVLEDIAGKTMLARVVGRVTRAHLVDEVVVATTSLAQDDPIVEACHALGVAVTRGSEYDVLERYHDAALAHAADTVIRITSDCPFVDPVEIDRVIETFLELTPDYASNSLDPRFPRGSDAEVFTFAALARAHHEATRDFERVHVTPYLYRNPERFRIVGVPWTEDYSDIRLTVDTLEDLIVARTLYEAFDGSETLPLAKAVAYLRSHPEVRAYNAHVRQKAVEEC